MLETDVGDLLSLLTNKLNNDRVFGDQKMLGDANIEFDFDWQSKGQVLFGIMTLHVNKRRTSRREKL